MKMKQEISIKKVIKDAEDFYKGGYFCCEAVVASIHKNFELDVPKEIIAMASGMAGGAGASGCMCGALNGAILVLGLFFGRSEEIGHDNPKVLHCMALTNELHDWFKEATKKNTVCCRALTKGFDMGKGEHTSQCIYFTGICAGKTAEIIVREMNLQNIDKQ